MINRVVSRFVILLFTLFFNGSIVAQLTPIDGDTINYTDVLIKFPWIEGVDKYKVKITKLGNQEDFKSFNLNKNAFIAENLEFESNYTWQYSGIDDNGELLSWSDTLSFYIGSSFGVDPKQTRFRVLSRERENSAPGLMFFDYAKAAVNRKGDPKWYLPEVKGVKSDALLRDLKMTDNGTFTALFDIAAIEFDRNGKILWKAPDDGKISGTEEEQYHHEFTKLENGNYLVLGKYKEFRKTPNENDSVNVEFGTIIEYNSKGEVVWWWNSKDYFTNKELFMRKGPNNFYHTATHMNSCVIEDSLVIVGFRDISRIVIINKNTNKVMESYGGYGFFEEPHSASGFFRRQHSGDLLQDGNIVVLNNDSVFDPSIVSSAVIFSRITPEQPTSKKIFEFPFDFDTLTDGRSMRTGNVLEMKNGNLLINMGALNRSIEITRDGKVVSDMFIEKFNLLTDSWKPFPQYRVSYSNSLYPYEFTSKVYKNVSKKKKQKVTIRIYNVGSKQDNYSLERHNKRGDTLKKSISIKPGQFADIDFELKKRKDYSFLIKSEHCLYTDKITLSAS